MSLKKFVTALAAVSLAVTPTVATAQVEPPPPDVESDGDEDRSGIGQILPLFIIAAIVLIIREVVKDNDSGDPPLSP